DLGKQEHRDRKYDGENPERLGAVQGCITGAGHCCADRVSGGIQYEYRGNRPVDIALVVRHQLAGASVILRQRAHLRRADRQERRFEYRAEERNYQYHRDRGDEGGQDYSVMWWVLQVTSQGPANPARGDSSLRSR